MRWSQIKQKAHPQRAMVCILPDAWEDISGSDDGMVSL